MQLLTRWRERANRRAAVEAMCAAVRRDHKDLLVAAFRSLDVDLDRGTNTLVFAGSAATALVTRISRPVVGGPVGSGLGRLVVGLLAAEHFARLLDVDTVLARMVFLSDTLHAPIQSNLVRREIDTYAAFAREHPELIVAASQFVADWAGSPGEETLARVGNVLLRMELELTSGADSRHGDARETDRQTDPVPATDFAGAL